MCKQTDASGLFIRLWWELELRCKKFTIIYQETSFEIHAFKVELKKFNEYEP